MIIRLNFSNQKEHIYKIRVLSHSPEVRGQKYIAIYSSKYETDEFGKPYESLWWRYAGQIDLTSTEFKPKETKNKLCHIPNLLNVFKHHHDFPETFRTQDYVYYAYDVLSSETQKPTSSYNHHPIDDCRFKNQTDTSRRLMSHRRLSFRIKKSKGGYSKNQR